MPLTRINPTDFVFSNDSTSNSCWVNANNDFVSTVGGAQQSSRTVSIPDLSGTFTYSDWYLGTPSNIQFSTTIAGNVGPGTLAMYGAIRNIVYGDKNAVFEWNGSTQNAFTVISINKSRYKNSLLPGSLRLGNYTDDSNINPPIILNCGRAYNIRTAPTYPNSGFGYGYGTGTSVGLFLPDVGLILSSITFNNLYASQFVLSYEDYTPTNRVFIRARNDQYNYSLNPSFISGSSGKIINIDWYNNPQTYITTVGLYNDNNELMATAKLPRPYNKNFNNELLMQIGLNF
jgi:hypothetical protein